jgi:two-component system phosphate regulon sensor histidine kinase PhoR
MKRKIFGNMFLLTIISVALSSVLISYVMYGNFYSFMKQEMKKEANYIAMAVELNGDQYLTQVANKVNANRVTLIAADGTVLFDSYYAAADMEKHANRPEFKEALRTGSGDSSRFSSTMSKQTFYHTLLLKDGTVLRVANTTDSVFASIMSSVPYLVLIMLVILALAMFLASRQTKKIIKPINELNLENPILNDTYDELSPLLTRINKQNKQIKTHIDELQKQQREFLTITENMSEGLVLLSSTTTILSINQSAIKMFCIESGDYIGKDILTVNRNLELQRVVEQAKQGQAGEGLMTQNGLYYQLMANPILKDSKVSGIVLLIFNVTEKHQVEQMRREFSANVSHELKTPLQSINGYAEIMKSGLVKPDDTPRFIEIIYSESQRLITLVDNIIRLSRLDENHIDFPREDVDLLALSREVLNRLIPQAEKKGVTLSASGEGAVITGVWQILEEMVYNLCDNAIKYNRANGRVDVTVSSSEKGAALSVSDTGIGIPQKHQNRVFERFYRVDKSHSKATGGTGLGLSIVKHGALVHNAKIKLTSEPGQGTTIEILFP